MQRGPVKQPYRKDTSVESPAQLIISAWVDERSGIEGALASVCSWFSDQDRVSSDWIANVKHLTVKLDEAAKPSC